jgi:TetR/AcrR family transcriptional repressor of nem operon
MNTQPNKHTEIMSTRQKIIEFSADMLRARGFDGFSYLDISRHLDIKKASVHHHFPKKVDLGLALCDWTQQWFEKGLSHFDAISTCYWNKLELYAQAAMKHTLTDKKLCPISAFYSDLNKLPESMKERLIALDDFELNWVTNVIIDGISNQEFKPHTDPRAIAGLYIFSCKGALYYARLHGKELFHQTINQLELLIKSKNQQTENKYDK